MNASRNSLLASLAPKDLALLGRHFKRAHLAHGAVLQEPGRPVEEVYFPLSGAISLVMVMRDGHAVETAIIGREGAIGLFADFGPWRATAGAMVQAPGIAECLPRSVLETAVSQSGSIRGLMLRYKEILTAHVHQTAACNALHTVEQRLARWLLLMSDRVEEADLPVTQEMLSQMLGVRRTTVTLVARKLQHDCLIRYFRGRIHINDRTGLRARACECYDTSCRRSQAFFEGLDLADAPAIHGSASRDRALTRPTEAGDAGPGLLLLD
jgi:CRP-like cAMP-binding protein